MPAKAYQHLPGAAFSRLARDPGDAARIRGALALTPVFALVLRQQATSLGKYSHVQTCMRMRFIFELGVRLAFWWASIRSKRADDRQLNVSDFADTEPIVHGDSQPWKTI